MVSYQDVRVKLTNTHLNKLKSAAKAETGKIREAFKVKNCRMNCF